MRCLLDTHVFLWMLGAPDRLDPATRALIEDDRHSMILSAVSSWEIAVKYALRQLPLPEPPETYVPACIRTSGVDTLAVEHSHALRVSVLDMHHRDPFDRLLVAQAQVERVPLISADRVFDHYDVELIRVD